MKSSSPASRRPLERGQFSWVSAVLLLGLAAAVYLGWVWGPVYVLHREVIQVVRGYANKAVHDPNDAVLVDAMCLRLGSLAQEPGEDAFGRAIQVPVVSLAPADVTWQRDAQASPPTLRIAFEYVRVVRYPLVDRTVETTMSVDLTSNIEVPKW